jgi:hypothetical protein
MDSDSTAFAKCFYCKAPVSKNNLEMDHFPIPRHIGGDLVVPSCRTCHDMKDRFNIEEWSSELHESILGELQTREARIFFAKAFTVILDYKHLYENALKKKS